ncbi:MAG: iron-containing alcohol dehydrogenase [Oscillospiraceae bacterium]|nr:iron-containing alcohol dehydrogenase [Oscillospiraceae bacterium]
MYQQHQFSCPIITGWGAISVLGEKIRELGRNRPLIVCDRGIVEAGITEKVGAVLREAGLEFAVFDGVMPDPSAEIVDEAVEAGLAFGCDCVLGVGGGSSMDTAKASTVRLSGYEGLTKDYVLAVPLKMETTVPVILVPTTTGTGSEVTRVAFISRPEYNVKWSVHLKNTTLAVVDPQLTVTLPRKETANTGLDALAHATEALTSKGADIHSDLFAVAAIEKIAENLYRSWSDPADNEARTNMAIAANWAGLAFDCPMCHLPHAIGDAFGCHFHTEHGHSCSLGLAEGLRLVAPVKPEKMAVIAKAMGIPLTGTETGAELGDLVADWIYALMRKMEFVSLHSMGISREEVIACAGDVAVSHLVAYCPVTITEEVAAEVLGRLYDSYH